VNNKIQKEETIELLKGFNKIDENITKNNAKSFLTENQKSLTKSVLERYIYSIVDRIYALNSNVRH